MDCGHGAAARHEQPDTGTHRGGVWTELGDARRRRRRRHRLAVDPRWTRATILAPRFADRPPLADAARTRPYSAKRINHRRPRRGPHRAVSCAFAGWALAGIRVQ